MKTDRPAEPSLSEVVEMERDLEFTGERIVPGKTEETLFREHEERYVFASQYVQGKEVLDVACGSGLGTDFLLRAGAAHCWGIDIDHEAINYAKAAYGGCNFLCGDATEMSLPDNSIDVVVSFETIEHVCDQEKFLAECKRVLRPNGQIICSTPNRIIYRWQGVNPFHIRELTAEEFSELIIGAHFGELELFSQTRRLYLLYVLRLLVSRALDRLKLKAVVKKVMPAPAISRNEFSANGHDVFQEFQPYRRSLSVQPMYVVAVARRV